MPVFRLQRGLAALAVFGVLTAPALDAQKKDDKKNPGRRISRSCRTRSVSELAPLVRTVDEVMKSGTRRHLRGDDEQGRRGHARAGSGRGAADLEERLPEGHQQPDLRALHRDDRAGQDRLVRGRLPARRAEGHERRRRRRRRTRRKPRTRSSIRSKTSTSSRLRARRAGPAAEADARVRGAGGQLRRVSRAARPSRGRREAGGRRAREDHGDEAGTDRPELLGQRVHDELADPGRQGRAAQRAALARAAARASVRARRDRNRAGARTTSSRRPKSWA